MSAASCSVRTWLSYIALLSEFPAMLPPLQGSGAVLKFDTGIDCQTFQAGRPSEHPDDESRVYS
jgi:hypothetical protein